MSGRPTLRVAGLIAGVALLATACADAGEVEDLARSVQEKVVTLAGDPARQAALISVAELPEPPDGMITVQLRIRYAGDALPGDGIRFYRPTPETEGLFTMQSLPADEPVPKGELIQDGIFFVEPRERAKIELVFENPTDELVAFEALPWFTEPESVKISMTAQCFCAALPFSAPALGSWYRTVWLDFGPPDIAAGTRMALTWTVVTDPTQWALLPGEMPEELIEAIAGGAPPPAAEAPPAGEEVPPPAEVELDIVGKDIQFSTSMLEVPADTPFTVIFDHQDEGVPHNFAIYEAGPPGSGLIAATEIETGPVVLQLTVDGLTAGTYFYQCDVHPQTMTGALEVG